MVTTVHSDYRLDYLGRPLHRLTYGTINTICVRRIPYAGVVVVLPGHALFLGQQGEVGGGDAGGTHQKGRQGQDRPPPPGGSLPGLGRQGDGEPHEGQAQTQQQQEQGAEVQVGPAEELGPVSGEV